jgi:hypothetical protein
MALVVLVETTLVTNAARSLLIGADPVQPLASKKHLNSIKLFSL